MTDKELNALLKLAKVVESLSISRIKTMREIAALLGPEKPKRRVRGKVRPKTRGKPKLGTRGKRGRSTRRSTRKSN